jgi:hypothetical protein
VAEWVGEVAFRPDVIDKLKRKHGVTPDEVVEAIAYGAHDTQVWHVHDVYGERLVTDGRTAAGRVSWRISGRSHPSTAHGSV